ncbi:THUMP domain-containing protein 1, partial [Armadillidium nasatum]
MGKNTKRSKSYYINNAKRRKNNELISNMKGFLCTTSTREKECVKEAYNILNEFAKKLYGSKNFSPNNEEKNCDSTIVVDTKIVDEDEESEEDIETALKSEVAALKCQNSSSSEQRLFQQVFVRVNNCIFISANISDPVELSISIMDSIIDSKMTITKHLVKLLPVQKTCRAFSDDIIKTTKELVLERFPKHKLRFYIA